MSDKPTITDADRECARHIVAEIYNGNGRVAGSAIIAAHREAAVKEAVEQEREVWRHMWRYQLRLIRAALIDEPDITPPPVAANANQGE